MTQANERTATLSELVADEVRVAMTRRRMSGRELATKLNVSPSWVSYRLSGKQPIDLNDLLRIANALGVGVHELLPPPDIAAGAAEPRANAHYFGLTVRTTDQARPRDNRPISHPVVAAPTGPGRTARVPRARRGRAI
jgi:transcriptional regulator with XRE-family HTH domain